MSEKRRFSEENELEVIENGQESVEMCEFECEGVVFWI
jgi:hypothetical protein